MQHSDRIEFIDILRGVAVVVMVTGHSIDAVLGLESRASSYFQLYHFLRGFTAPLFLFVAGLAFSVATEKRWSRYLTWTSSLRKRLLRVLLLLVIGYALHLPFFSVEKILVFATSVDLARLFQADVLHCVAASLLILHALIMIVRSQDLFAMSVFGLAILFIMATPLVSGADLSGFVTPALSPYFNQQQLSLFPLFPYAGFLFSGVAAGHFFLRSGRRGMRREFAGSMAAAAAILAGMGVVADALPFSVFPTHSFWTASPLFFFIKLSVICLLSAGIASVAQFPRLLHRHLTTLGQASLMVYAVHIIIVYGSAANIGLMQLVGRSLTAAGAMATGLAVLAVMLILVHGWDRVVSRYRAESRYVQAGFAATILYLFLIRPF